MSISAEQQALADGALLIAALLGVGGDTWIVSRTSGDGVTSSPMPVPIGTWSGRVKRSRATQQVSFGQGGALPGARAALTEFHAIGATATIAPDVPDEPIALAVGDLLQSATDSTLRFRISAPYAVAGYVRYILEPL